MSETGGEWDIKQDLDADFYETTWNGTTWQIPKDVFGNIHDGAVLDEADLTSTEATHLAGLGKKNTRWVWEPAGRPVTGVKNRTHLASTTSSSATSDLGISFGPAKTWSIKSW
ncbi:MAG: hypothetical protein QNJ12_16945 [Ilumatobacter sp.]|uniref:hypothetical protein n=1 Tax=Ilumatobacter sp. TaxID=1967498 RepID=UPI00260362B9|nr:hypothetical protein [Ilumatobacter sp.]MDJ0770483.1 hypothetical protein [Ilumatobacter sp.]